MSTVRVEKHNYTVEPFYQWDRNQVLEIHGLSLPRTPEVHFYNNTMDRAVVRQATMDSAGIITVSVPNGLLQKPYTITAHLCVYNGATFETQYTIKLPVTPRTQPADYTIEDDGDVYSFNELNNKVGQAVADLKAAEERFNSSIGDLRDKIGEGLIDTTLSQAGKAADAKAVSDALAKAIKDFADGLEGVVLWENPDPSAVFGAQTIELDLSQYRRFSVLFREYTTAGSIIVSSCTVKNESIKAHQAEFGDRYYSITDTGITFTQVTNTNYTNRTIPYKLIGYKY